MKRFFACSLVAVALVGCHGATVVDVDSGPSTQPAGQQAQPAASTDTGTQTVETGGVRIENKDE
jgi:trehalose-6-phosphatase